MSDASLGNTNSLTDQAAKGVKFTKIWPQTSKNKDFQVLQNIEDALRKEGIWSGFQTPNHSNKRSNKHWNLKGSVGKSEPSAFWPHGPQKDLSRSVKLVSLHFVHCASLCIAARWFSARAFFVRCTPDGMRSTSTGCQKHLSKSHSVRLSWVNLKVLKIFLHHLNDRRHSGFIAKDCRLQGSFEFPGYSCTTCACMSLFLLLPLFGKAMQSRSLRQMLSTLAALRRTRL